MPELSCPHLHMRTASEAHCCNICLSRKVVTSQAFDGRVDTHWFSRDGRSLAERVAAHVWLEYCLPAQAGSVTLVAYTLTAASGRPENDPVHIVLHGVRMHCKQLATYFSVSAHVPYANANRLMKSIEHACCLCCIARG